MRVRSPRITASPAAAATLADTTATDISFITVAYGTGPVLVATINSLIASIAHLPLDAEVIVVDNPHPTRGRASTTELLLGTSGVRVVEAETNLGFGGGCELGALYARSDILAFVNPDITFASDWLQPLLAELARPNPPSIIGPVLVDADGEIEEVGQSLDRRGNSRPNLERPSSPQAIPVDFSSAACWLMTRDEHERLGGFDAQYHPAYFEDADLAMRAWALGGSCEVHSGVEVTHHRGTGTPDRPQPAFDQQATFRQKWPDLRWKTHA